MAVENKVAAPKLSITLTKGKSHLYWMLITLVKTFKLKIFLTINKLSINIRNSVREPIWYQKYESFSDLHIITDCGALTAILASNSINYCQLQTKLEPSSKHKYNFW